MSEHSIFAPGAGGGQFGVVPPMAALAGAALRVVPVLRAIAGASCVASA
ncbi:hypothetical protein [Mycobacterium marinum]